MIHLLWIIPAYIVIGFLIARFCMRFSGTDANSAASLVLAWPLFIPFCIVVGVHTGISRVLRNMEKRNENQKR